MKVTYDWWVFFSALCFSGFLGAVGADLINRDARLLRSYRKLLKRSTTEIVGIPVTLQRPDGTKYTAKIEAYLSGFKVTDKVEPYNQLYINGRWYPVNAKELQEMRDAHCIKA